MSSESIYRALRSGGLSAAGACAMMGNMYCESLLKSNNVEDRCTMSDSDYTWNVDHGIISRWQFGTDAYGYGLCQWTYHTRKMALYEYAHQEGVSIADEKMQCEFCIMELQKDFSGLYTFLCGGCDLRQASDRICKEFENPAICNYADRQNASMRYYNELADIPVDSDPVGGDPCDGDSCPVDLDVETCSPVVRVLLPGYNGSDVVAAQAMLLCKGYDIGKWGPHKNGVDGDFGGDTERAVNRLRNQYGMPEDGRIDLDVWQILFQ